MPIDPSIALGVRPVQFADPVESYGRALTLRHLIQQGQLGAEQLHGAQLENQQHEQAIQDDQTIRQLYGQSGGDMDKLQQLAAGKVSPQMLEKLRTASLETREKLSKIKETDLKNVAAQNAAVASSASAILKLPADQRPAAYQQERAQLLQQGILTPDHAPEQYPGDEALQLQLDHATAADTQFTQEMKRREDTRAAAEEKRKAALAPFQQGKAESDAGNAAFEYAGRTVAGVQPADWAKWRSRLPASVQAQIPAEYSEEAKAQVRRLAVPVEKQPQYDIDSSKAALGLLGNSEYDQFLAAYAQKRGKTPATLNPDEKLKSFTDFAEAKKDPVMREMAIAQKNLAMTLQRIQIEGAPTKEDAAMLADDIINHRLAPDQLSQIRGRGNGQLGIMIERELKRQDPKFSWEQASSEFQLAKSPQFQQNVRYMDSVAESIPMVIDRANKLANGNVRSLNALLNAGRNQFNDVDLKRFKTDATLVADEIAKILQGGGTGTGTSDAKLKQAGEILGSTDSPAAIAAALGDVKELIGFRRKALTRGTYLENAAPQTGGGAAAAGGGGKKPLSEIFK